MRGQPALLSTWGQPTALFPLPSTGYPPFVPMGYPQNVENTGSGFPQRYPRIMKSCPRIMVLRPHVLHSKIFWTFSVHTNPQPVHR
jgi:hypothetical protein